MDKVTNKIQTSAPEDTGHKRDSRFKPGLSGNPAGRPKGARSRLGERFIEALASDFEQHGEEVVEKVRVRDPVQYLKVVANILPREVVVAALNVNASIDFDNAADAKTFLRAYRFCQAEALPAPEGEIITEACRHDE